MSSDINVSDAIWLYPSSVMFDVTIAPVSETTLEGTGLPGVKCEAIWTVPRTGTALYKNIPVA